MPFIFKKMDIPDVILIEPRIFGDKRGFFAETYKKSEFVENGIAEDFLQDNHSLSQKGVLRGLHFQENPRAQGKLVRVVKGRVWDVAVDVRKSSPTFLKWVSVELSEENNFMFYIPAGFAHGFVSLTDDVHLTYKCTHEYSPEHDGGIRWDDPDLGLPWPVENPLVSDKDAELPYLKDARLFK
jgi:dTDP-4-dehydrorhamnose 3,5-epimerase